MTWTWGPREFWTDNPPEPPSSRPETEAPSRRLASSWNQSNKSAEESQGHNNLLRLKMPRSLLCLWWSHEVALKVSVVSLHGETTEAGLDCHIHPMTVQNASKCWVYRIPWFPHGFPHSINRWDIWWHLVIQIFSSRSVLLWESTKSLHGWLSSCNKNRKPYEIWHGTPKKNTALAWRSYYVNLPCLTCWLENHNNQAWVDNNMFFHDLEGGPSLEFTTG